MIGERELRVGEYYHEMLRSDRDQRRILKVIRRGAAGIDLLAFDPDCQSVQEVYLPFGEATSRAQKNLRMTDTFVAMDQVGEELSSDAVETMVHSSAKKGNRIEGLLAFLAPF